VVITPLFFMEGPGSDIGTNAYFYCGVRGVPRVSPVPQIRPYPPPTSVTTHHPSPSR